MAKIPTSAFRGNIRADLGTPVTQPVSQAGLGFSGLKDLGQGIAEVGSAVGNIFERRDKAQADNYINKLQTETQKRSAEQERDAQNFYAGSSFEGYANERQEFLQEQRDLAIEEAPNDRAKQRASQYFDRIQTKSFIQAQAFEKKQTAGFYLDQDQKNRKTRGETLFEYPSLANTAEAKAELDSYVTTSELYDPAQKLDELEKNKALVKNSLDGHLNAGGKFLNEGIAFVRGQTKYKGLEGALSPQQKAGYERKFKSAITAETNRRLMNLSVEAEEVIALTTARGATPSDKDNIAGLTKQFEGLRNIEGISKRFVDKHVRSLKKTSVTLEAKERFKNKQLIEIPEELPALKKRLSKVSSREELEVVATELKAVSDYIKEAQEDGGGLAIKENPTLPEFSQELYQYQKNRGFNRPRYSSNAASERQIGIFETAPNRKKELEGFLKTGDVKAKLSWIKAQGNTNNTMASVSLAATSTSPTMQRLLLDAVPPEAFPNHPNGEGVTDKSIVQELNKNSEDFLRAFSGERQSAFLHSINKARTIRVKELVMSGSSLEEAVKQTNKETIEKEYVYVDSGDDRIPLSGKFKSKKHKDAIQAFVDVYDTAFQKVESSSTFKGTQALAINKKEVRGALIRDLEIDYTANTKENSNIKSNEDFVDVMFQNEAKFMPSADGEGLVVVLTHPKHSHMQKLKRWRETPTGERIKEDVTFSFEEITSPSSRFYGAIVKELNSSGIISSTLNELARGTAEGVKAQTKFMKRIFELGGELTDQVSKEATEFFK